MQSLSSNERWCTHLAVNSKCCLKEQSYLFSSCLHQPKCMCVCGAPVWVQAVYITYDTIYIQSVSSLQCSVHDFTHWCSYFNTTASLFSYIWEGNQECYYLVKFYNFLTMHLRIILAGNQLGTQFLLWYVYLNPLHVSSNPVLILRRTIVLIQQLV